MSSACYMSFWRVGRDMVPNRDMVASGFGVRASSTRRVRMERRQGGIKD